MERVVALVVQPGVEFGTDNVVTYDAGAARPLALLLDRHPHLVFEAHSTDYQPRSALAALVQDGFAIRKVGPWLTFALRETLYSLDAMAAALDGGAPQLSGIMERLMLAMPQHWNGHYHGPVPQQRLMRHYSYSDRIRYYWPMPEAEAAVGRLLARLAGAPLPTMLISQFLPGLRERVASGLLPARPHDLLIAAVTDVLARYDHPHRKAQTSDDQDAEAIAEAATRPRGTG
jgi:D-tagatose-1,6-bisphosphate aldolase subunit GatZ/KbaZ